MFISIYLTCLIYIIRYRLKRASIAYHMHISRHSCNYFICGRQFIYPMCRNSCTARFARPSPTSGRLVSQQETGRVASIPSSGQENFLSSEAASSRSVCVTADSTAGDVYDIGSGGQSSTGSRCAGSGVGFQAGLRVPTPQSGTNSVISTGRVPVQNAAYRPMLVRHLLGTDYLESPVRPTAQATLAQGSGDSCPVRATTEAAEFSPSDTTL